MTREHRLKLVSKVSVSQAEEWLGVMGGLVDQGKGFLCCGVLGNTGNAPWVEQHACYK